MNAGDTRTRGGALVLLVVLAALPLAVDPFWLTVLSLVFLYALVGVAWNLMMGYAGQLSLGHALYFGLGAYIVAVLSERYGISPWLGMIPAMLFPALCGVVIGALGFRFGVRGVYFALLTIAFAEFARILFEHWDYTGKTAGFFMSALKDTNRPLVSLRGGAMFFYYALLVSLLAAWTVSVLLVRSRFGFYWRAIREDEDAARALGVNAFRAKLAVVALSAAMTGAAGGWYALMNGSLFPDSVFGMRLSIDLIIAPIIGGLGTLFGPLLGAAIVVPLNEIAKALGQGTGINGLNILIYGLLLMFVVLAVPDGVWPWLARRLGLAASGGAMRQESGRDREDGARQESEIRKEDAQ